MQENKTAEYFRKIATEYNKKIEIQAKEQFFNDLFDRIRRSANIGRFQLLYQMPIKLPYDDKDVLIHPSEINAYLCEDGFITTWDTTTLKISWAESFE